MRTISLAHQDIGVRGKITSSDFYPFQTSKIRGNSLFFRPFWHPSRCPRRARRFHIFFQFRQIGFNQRVKFGELLGESSGRNVVGIDVRLRGLGQ